MKRTTAVLCVTLGVACSDEPTAPSTRDLALTICNVSPNTWIAYQNERTEWKRLDLPSGAQGNIPITIKATERIGVARSSMNATATSTSLFYGTADQVREWLACGAGRQYDVRHLNGSMQGVSSQRFAGVSIGPSIGWLNASQTNFELPFAAMGTRDLIAARYVDSSYVDKLIIRRQQAHANGVIPLLDFESGEALATESSTLTLGSGAEGSHTFVRVDFRGADQNYFPLQSASIAPGATTAPMRAVPPSSLVAGDIHGIYMATNARQVLRYYQGALGDRTFAFGPHLTTPTFTGVFMSPNLRVDVDLPSQPEYDGYVDMWLTQHTHMQFGTMIFIIATREYFGELPATWSISVPDLRAVPGFQTSMALFAGVPYSWTVSATNRRWGASMQSAAAGDELRLATRSGTNQ